MTEKLKMGFFGLTGCAGCQLSVIFEDEDFLNIATSVDILAWPFVKEVNKEDNFDYIFMEGLVASNDDKEILIELRKKTKFLVALGACAHTGCVPAYRHFSLKENYAHLLYEKDTNIKDVPPSPIDEFVHVDYTVPGCPPDKNEIKEFIKDVIKGSIPKPYNNPVCFECKKNSNACLLDVGKPCLGPITRGGCNSICVNGGLECWGCRGPTDDANVDVMVDVLLKQGHDKKMIKDRFYTFAGKKMPKIKGFTNGKNN